MASASLTTTPNSISNECSSRTGRENPAFSAFFFDMDGTLFDSMPNHAWAWETVMARYNMSFPAAECYRNEGRTGQDVIWHVYQDTFGKVPDIELIQQIYHEKTELFRQRGGAQPMAGVLELLQYLKTRAQLWIVTGSGQQSLFDTLNHHFPNVFARERMITAFDVTHGKPDPEPYLKAWERSGLSKEQCCVIENAPLGVRSGHLAGVTTFAVNTGPLPDELLWQEHADRVFPSMAALLAYLKEEKE